LLCIGRFEERKGIATAITAVQRHNRSSDVPWRLRIIGDGPQAAQLHALGDGDIAIDFLGAVSDEEKLHELRGAHALLCPALYGESFGLVLLEGMAAETAVVASDIDGYREAAGGQATLAAPGDEASWERAITLALSTESIASARAHAENWGMSSLVTRYEERYRRLVEIGSAQ
jgi:phosphatidylinositol alpha-mannosyltransferase